MLKKIQKFIIIGNILIVSLFSLTSVSASNDSECKECSLENEDVLLISSEKTSSGEKIDVFDDGIVVKYSNDGYIYISKNRSSNFDNENTRGVWTTLGIVVWTVLSGCSTIEYVTGHDLCREVLRYVSNPTNGREYTVEGIYYPGYIPGCEPRYSGPCNAGYWNYRVS